MPLHKGADGFKGRLIFIACAAVVLLSAWIQMRVVAGTEVIHPIRADAAKYVSYAWNLREFHTFSYAKTWQSESAATPAPDKLTLPGYPLFLTLFLDGRPDNAFIVKVTTAQALLGIFTCILVLMIAWRLLPPPWAVLVGVLTAISPHLATINTYLLTESLFTFLLAATTYAVVRAAEAPTRMLWFLIGAVLLAATCHVRAQLQFLPAALLLGLAISPVIRRHWVRVVASVALFMAFMAPWQLRNAAVESPAGDPNLMVATLYHGSFPDFMYRGDPQTFGFPYRSDPNAYERTRSLREATDWIRSEFARAPGEMTRWYLFGKPYYFMSWGIIAGMGDVFIYPTRHSPFLEQGPFEMLHWLSRRLHYPLMILGLISALAGSLRPSLLTKTTRAQGPVWVLSITLLAVIFLHMIGAPFPRYGIPFRWMFYLLAAFPLMTAWNALRRLKSRTATKVT